MKLSIENLQAFGGFSGAVVRRKLSFELDGKEYTYDVNVRRLSYFEAVDVSEDKGPLMAQRIAASIVDDGGLPVFRVADVTGFEEDGEPVLDDSGKPRGGLFTELIIELSKVIAEVNGLGKSQTSAETTSSGTS